MKRYYLLGLFSILSLNLFAQNNQRRILGDFIFKGEVYSYEFSQDDINNYSLYLSKFGSRESRTEEKSAEVAKPDTNIYFHEFSKTIFEKVFLGQMKEKYKLDPEVILKEKTSEIFFTINAQLKLYEDEPVTGYMILKKDSVFSFLRAHPGGYYNGDLGKAIASHIIHKVQIETDDGTIKNITLKVVKSGSNINHSPRRFLEFKNQYPISVSGKFDPEKFANIDLYCTNCDGLKGLSRFIRLSSFFSYEIIYDNDKENYSPANKIMSLSPNNPIVEVKKEKRSKIVDISSFSDFAGLNQEKPNGLVQFEVKRKVIINSNHKQFGKDTKRKVSKKVLESLEKSKNINPSSENKASNLISIKGIDPTRVYSMEGFVDKFKLSKDTEFELIGEQVQKEDYIYYRISDTAAKYKSENSPDAIKINKLPSGVWIKNSNYKPLNYVWFNNVEFQVKFLKLEENNRSIPTAEPDSKNEDTFKVRPIDLYKYQLSSVGAELDIIKINYTQLKFSWNLLHVGVHWFGARITAPTSDAAENQPTDNTFLNNIMLQPGTSVRFRPDSRWGITAGIKYINPAIWSQKYKVSNTQGLFQYFCEGFWAVSANSQLFARFRLSHEVKHRYQNFAQFQLGYTIDIFNRGQSSANGE